MSSILSLIVFMTLISSIHGLTLRERRMHALSQQQIETQHNMGVNPFSTPFYMHIKGTNDPHKDIQGTVTERGKEGTIAVYDIDHTVSSLPIPGTIGHGPHHHQPLKIRIDLDRIAPILYQMWSSNENMEISIDQWSAPSSALSLTSKLPKVVFTTKLTNANIVSIHNIGGAQLEILLTYSKIEWTWLEGGIRSEDVWN